MPWTVPCSVKVDGSAGRPGGRDVVTFHHGPAGARAWYTSTWPARNSPSFTTATNRLAPKAAAKVGEGRSADHVGREDRPGLVGSADHVAPVQ